MALGGTGLHDSRIAVDEELLSLHLITTSSSSHKLTFYIRKELEEMEGGNMNIIFVSE